MEESHRDGDSASGEPAADRMPSFKNILQKRHLKRFLKLKHSVSFFFFFFKAKPNGIVLFLAKG